MALRHKGAIPTDPSGEDTGLSQSLELEVTRTSCCSSTVALISCTSQDADP